MLDSPQDSPQDSAQESPQESPHDSLQCDWYVEKHTNTAGLTFQVKERLFSTRSKYQQIEVLETESFGRVFLLDGCVMLTERDEFVYHEMLVHPALLLHANPKRVLIIGGGDGGSLREVLRYSSVEQATLVEIDEQVVATARQWLPALASSFDDARVKVHHADGFAYLHSARQFDAILVDSTDPVGEAAKLFTPAFYQRVQQALSPQGVAVFQTESPFFHNKVCLQAVKDLKKIFKHVRLYLAHIPTYPSGCWSFCLASDQLCPNTAQWQKPPFFEQLKYFNPNLAKAAFALPSFLKDALSKLINK